MALVIYGPPPTRAGRVFWLLRELGIEAESVVPDLFAGEMQTPDFLAMNPMGQVPVMVDDDFVLAESLAINLYLATKYGGPLAPAGLRETALATQWSFWVQGTVEPHFLPIIAHRTGLPPEHRSAEIAAAGEAQLARPLGALDAHLSKSRHIAAERFTVADLNVAAVMAPAIAAGIDLSPFPKVQRWADAAFARRAAEGLLEPVVFPPPIVAHFLSQAA